MMVAPDELKENAPNLVAGMRRDAELNRQALLLADDLCATRASLAEQRALAIAVVDRATGLARALAKREVELHQVTDEFSSGRETALGTSRQLEAQPPVVVGQAGGCHRSTTQRAGPLQGPCW